MQTHYFSCKEARRLDIVEYMEKLGHVPQKVNGKDNWYLSPLRAEKTASFKVNRTLNVWYDHGLGKGGNLVDFGVLYFKCSVAELLHGLSNNSPSHFSFHPPSKAGEKKEPQGGKIQIVAEHFLSNKSLLDYLKERAISLDIAKQFCKEIDFELYGKKQTVIGFKNNAGGYELRSADFKGSSSPKDITFIDNKKEQIGVFEGFFDYLSFLTLHQQQRQPLTNFLVLNSLAFFQQARIKMEEHSRVLLYLDGDSAGSKHTRQALEWDSNKYTDQRFFYKHYKDLNEYLIQQAPPKKESLKRGMHL